MTLVITWRTDKGIIMTADSAITNPEIKKVIAHRTKIFQIPYLNAGVSFYGKAKINDLTTGQWLKDFIDENEEKIADIHEFSELLMAKANSEIGKIKGNTGFHIAGYCEKQNKKVAYFHHINNKLKDDYYDVRLRDVFEDDGSKQPEYFTQGKIIHNGDYLIFNRFLQHSLPLFDSITRSMDNVVLEFVKRNYRVYTPFTSDITGYKTLLTIFLKIIHSIYEEFSKVNKDYPKFVPIVGGKVSYIIITEDGIQEYENNGLPI